MSYASKTSATGGSASSCTTCPPSFAGAAALLRGLSGALWHVAMDERFEREGLREARLGEVVARVVGWSGLW
jgi:hypothetical protein